MDRRKIEGLLHIMVSEKTVYKLAEAMASGYIVAD